MSRASRRRPPGIRRGPSIVAIGDCHITSRCYYDPTAQARTFDADGSVSDPGSRLIDVSILDGATETPHTVGGAPVGEAPSINVAVNSLNAGGGDQYPVLPDKNKVSLGLSTQQALAEHVTEQTPIGAGSCALGVNKRVFPIFS